MRKLISLSLVVVSVALLGTLSAPGAVSGQSAPEELSSPEQGSTGSLSPEVRAREILAEIESIDESLASSLSSLDSASGVDREFYRNQALTLDAERDELRAELKGLIEELDSDEQT